MHVGSNARTSESTVEEEKVRYEPSVGVRIAAVRGVEGSHLDLMLRDVIMDVSMVKAGQVGCAASMQSRKRRVLCQSATPTIVIEQRMTQCGSGVEGPPETFLNK